ncbi:MAG: hypothetical protein IJW03_02855 [Clostridia bacterium]|nr:hypothetical protein [Clostridia bacterium]
MISKCLKIGEYALAGMYEECERDLFYRKSLGLRRYYENCRLNEYRGELLYPSGTRCDDVLINPHYLEGFAFNINALREKSPELASRVQEDFCKYKSTVPAEHAVGGNMYTHSMPHYERILAEGLLSYIPRIEKIENSDMRDGLLHVVYGIKRYVERSVEYLSSVGADKSLVDALSRVPLYPARTVYEAIVAWNFVMYLDNCDNLGCLAKGLLPYYKGEDIVAILENLYDNIDKNNGYSMSLGSECDELVVQCLRASRGKRRPMIELFVNKDTSKAVWDEAIALVNSGGGQPAFYNADVLLGGLKRRFPSIADEDITRFCGGGCTESMIAGCSNVGSLDAGINLLLVFEDVMNRRLCDVCDFEEFYKAYIDAVSETVALVKREINNSRRARALMNPLPMRTLLVDDCIDSQTEFNSGGARYNWSIINFAGLINVIDSMLAIKELCFDTKKYTPDEILDMLHRGDENFLREAKNLARSFGKGDKECDSFASRISRDVFSMTREGEVCFGEGFLSASIQFMSQAMAGRHVGATPDGRRAASPLCDSLGAIFAKDTDGPTALLNSVSALSLENALGVPVLNFNISKHFSDEVLVALIKGYFESGGIQMQITRADEQEIIDAYLHPEEHKNLIVRVGGYSEYFWRLSDDVRQVVLNRTIQK